MNAFEKSSDDHANGDGRLLKGGASKENKAKENTMQHLLPPPGPRFSFLPLVRVQVARVRYGNVCDGLVLRRRHHYYHHHRNRYDVEVCFLSM